MIDKETLIRIAKFTGLKPFQQEKNYIQTLLLRSIFSRISRELIFKGGTALAFFYGLNRFSEDLDFTLRETIDFEGLIKETKKDFEALNVRANFRILEDDPSSFSFRIGAEGPLFTKEIERCFVGVEISKREEVLKEIEVKELNSPYPDISNFFVPVMNLEEILAEKIRAIIWRAKARDLYDLWFLLEKEIKVDLDVVNKKLSCYKKIFDKEKIERLGEVWKTELRPVVLGHLPEFNIVKNSVLKVIEVKKLK
ncbi:MAG: nucleotidyl transferase AbiEii/AbiGii toxin family protein [Candidatus Aenigmarchaeota archaeon]|nr:nucleotidyl transferase AbiEii/AbiGii toxin family protein [Candidatus Aenigmarchaeota archaeon]